MKILKRSSALFLAFALIFSMALAPTADAYSEARLDSTNVLAAGESHAGAVNEYGELYTWGSNSSGQLGNGSKESSDRPIWIMDDVKSFAASYYSSAAIKNDGSLWIWGNGVATPQKVLDHVVSVALGGSHTSPYYAAIRADGSLWMWGKNWSGQLGDGTTDYHEQPIKVMDDVASVSLGERGTTAVVKTDGSLWTWGDNQYGLLGTASEEDYCPDPCMILSNIQSVSVGYYAAGAVDTDGNLWMWGLNNCQLMGLSRDELYNSDVPVQVYSGVDAVFVGSENTAIIKNGSLLTCGRTSSGVVGSGFTNRQEVSSWRTQLSRVATASMGNGTAFAITEAGELYAWGHNGGGHLGIGKGKGNGNCLALAFGDTNCQFGPKKISGFNAAVPSANYYSPVCFVILELGGGSGMSSVACKENGLLTPPNNPSREGYFFAGWFKDAECTVPWNFDTDRVYENLTLHAKWLPKTTTTTTATPTTQKLILDGKTITLNTYALYNELGYPVNFVKLRDIAYLLNGTDSNFNVDWRNNSIRLDTNRPYTTQNGAELTVPTTIPTPANTSVTPVLTNGVTAQLEAFLLIDANGGGHNYFKLRDIGAIAGFHVDWNSELSCIVITTGNSAG